MNIHESAEDYLERILMIKQEKGNVRSIDIANDMNFSRASVSHAMKLLKENNYIEIDEIAYPEVGYGKTKTQEKIMANIELLEKGNEIAENILHRHHLLTNLFIKIGVDEKIAQQDACKIEHDLSKETFAAIEKLVENL